MAYIVPVSEVEFTAVRSQGPGGQHVNKTSTAIQLRFSVIASGLPQAVKQRLLAIQDNRLTADGVVIIKAQSSRSQDQNKAEAMARLQELVAQAEYVKPRRKATRPTLGSNQRRLTGKAVRSNIKLGRGKVTD
jgi:ribosome-associated protein